MGITPPYTLYHNDPRPEVHWVKPNGEWVAVWGYDWLDLIGEEILKLTDHYEYEVWQPDLRADKIYSHVYPSGLVHKLYPAEYQKRIYGFKTLPYVTSQSICDNLVAESRKGQTIVRLSLMDPGIGRQVMKLSLDCAVIAQFWGEFENPLHNLHKFKKNLATKINDLVDHLTLNTMLRRVDAVTCSDEKTRNELAKYFKKEVISLSIGIDFNYWKRRLSKKKARDKLRLGNDRFIIFSAARLNSLKQIDKVIESLMRLDGNFDFSYVVAGHGERQYEQYLSELGATLIENGKLRFVGYVSDEELVNFYEAADLFIMSSRSEAGPTGSIKAMAMEVPVFSTNTGQMSEVLVDNDAGVVVPTRDYGIWDKELREILNGKHVKILDREVVKAIHHWPIVAAQYIELYRQLFRQYYG